MSTLDTASARAYIDEIWAESIVPTLQDYIRIPNKSPAFDPKWAEHGYMDQAVELAHTWAKAHAPKGAEIAVVRLEGRTPVLMVEVPGSGDRTVLLYGHLDKQPEMVGWDEGLGPWEPVIRDEKLYGRGGADDGYAVFASLTAINALQRQGVPHARCIVLIECCEESGSYDLPHYIDHLRGRIGEPDLVVCLDSGCGNYDQLWCTTSLRGMVSGDLRIEVLTEGVHSGDASGIVASSFRVARILLDRIEDAQTGQTRLPELEVEIPAQRREQAAAASAIMGEATVKRFPWAGGMGPVETDATELVLNRTWRSTLSVTGVDGLPTIANAGNVLRPQTQLKLSFRLPPTADPEAAYAAVKRTLEADPPYGAKVSFEGDGAPGWNAPALADWLGDALNTASEAWFGPGAAYMGEGGTIPFMGMLGEKFPQAQFVITGVLGPKSNAHGPNEFLHIPTARALTGAMAQVLAIHHAR